MRARCIGCVTLYVNHTAVELKDSFDDVLLQWGLEATWMSGLTTDNASNNKCAFKQYEWISCFGHNLDLAIRKALVIEQVNKALIRLRKLISGFDRSSKRKQQLKVKQAERGLPQHQHDEPARWGSTYDMVERFIEQQSAFCAILVDDIQSWPLIPHDVEICVFETLKLVLGPLSEFTDALSGENHVTISGVQPILWKIISILETSENDNDLTKEMKLIIADDDLKQRYAENKLRLLLDCATYLDARFKNSFVMESDEVKQKLLTEITNVSPVADLVGDSVVDQSDGIPPNKRVKTGGLAGVLERIRSEKK